MVFLNVFLIIGPVLGNRLFTLNKLCNFIGTRFEINVLEKFRYRRGIGRWLSRRELHYTRWSACNYIRLPSCQSPLILSAPTTVCCAPCTLQRSTGAIQPADNTTLSCCRAPLITLWSPRKIVADMLVERKWDVSHCHFVTSIVTTAKNGAIIVQTGGDCENKLKMSCLCMT